MMVERVIIRISLRDSCPSLVLPMDQTNVEVKMLDDVREVITLTWLGCCSILYAFEFFV